MRVKELWSNDRANKIIVAKWNCLHRQKLLNSFLSWLTQTPPKQSCFDVDKQKSAKLAGYAVKLPEACLKKVPACRLNKFECFPNKMLLTSLLVPSTGIVVLSGEPCLLFKLELFLRCFLDYRNERLIILKVILNKIDDEDIFFVE